MNSLKSALKLLAKGEFVCHVRFESEYEALATPEGQQQAAAPRQQAPQQQQSAAAAAAGSFDDDIPFMRHAHGAAWRAI